MARGICLVAGRQAGFLWVTNTDPPRWEEAVIYAELPTFVDYPEWQGLVMEFRNLSLASEHLVNHWGGRMVSYTLDMLPVDADSLLSRATEMFFAFDKAAKAEAKALCARCQITGRAWEAEA